MISLIIFWSCLALVAYVYLAFPALVILRGLVRPRPHRRERIEPTVSMIVAAHNEAGSIADKIENLLSLDYPRERLQIIIASDGSDDGTETIVEPYQPHGVMLLRLPRRGKANALNAAASAATGEVLVFSDANSMFAPDAVKQLLLPLADPMVGGVAGDQRYLKSSGGASGERAYWSLDRLLKRFESRADSVVSATGAIYAIRRSLFVTVPDGVTDDFVTSTRVIEQGYRLVFAENAVAWEPPAAKTSVEFGRKVRVMTRGLRGVWVVRRLLNPLSHGLYSWQLFSHKVLRRLAVFPLVGLAVSTPFLWSHGGFYQAATIAQALFYGCGLIGGMFGQTVLGRQKLFSVPWYLMVVNAAALMAVLNLLRGRQLVLWEPQRTRGGESPAEHVPAAFSMGQHAQLETIQR